MAFHRVYPLAIIPFIRMELMFVKMVQFLGLFPVLHLRFRDLKAMETKVKIIVLISEYKLKFLVYECKYL
jgi:hypothetical protein